MPNLCLHPLLLRLWSFGYRLRQAVRRRSRATRRVTELRGAFYDEVWRDAAEHCGASMVSRGQHAFEIHRGVRTLKVCCNATDLDSTETLDLAGNKPAVHRLLSGQGLPTPRFAEFNLKTLPRALEFLAGARKANGGDSRQAPTIADSSATTPSPLAGEGSVRGIGSTTPQQGFLDFFTRLTGTRRELRALWRPSVDGCGSVGRPAATMVREETGAACVVKPARDTGGGHGVTTGVTTPFELAWAIAAALPMGDDFLIEQQVPGENYRLLYLDGKLVDAVLRRPPQVIADGRSSVADLLDRLNADRVSRGFEESQVLVTRNLDLRRTLAGQGLHLGSVPPAGSCVVLKTVINENSADDNESVRDRVCPSIVAAGMRAVSLVGARLAGVDIVTTDIARPLSETGGVILEVNTTPGFHYHYHNRSGRCAVARQVLDAVLNAPGVVRELDYAN